MSKESDEALSHLAIIPDGNRRWAKKHNKSLEEAYDVGIRKFLDVAKWARKFNIKVFSAWGFSTENFKRDEEEKKILWRLFSKFLDEMIEKYKKEEKEEKHKVRINFLGRLYLFPDFLQKKMKELSKLTENNKPYVVNFLMAYGGRAEIIDAVNDILRRGLKKVSESEFESFLYTKGIADPDLIIRTGGEKRLSGFLSWQSSYSELVFIDKLWPDFEEKDLEFAINDFKARKRRFGK